MMRPRFVQFPLYSGGSVFINIAQIVYFTGALDPRPEADKEMTDIYFACVDVDGEQVYIRVDLTQEKVAAAIQAASA
jgi:hypothetical protein